MITIKSTCFILRIEEGINRPISGDYHITTDQKWLKFKRDHNLKVYDDLFKWYDLYLRLCAEGLL